MPRPQLKVNVPYFAADAAIHFQHSGKLISFDDPDGRVGTLLQLLDGTREIDDVYRDLHAAYADLTPTDLAEALQQLDSDGLIQDASDAGDDFSPAEKHRWSRNLAYFEVAATMETSKYELQRRIAKAKVALLGVGGIGSHCLIDMVAIGFTDIRIVDFDTVDPSNLNRQILYTEQDVGQPKTALAAARARALNSAVRIDPVETMILSAETAYELVADRDIVVSAVDRPKATIMHWINEGCVRAGAALIGGGIEMNRGVVYSMIPGVTGCLECWYAGVRATDPTSAIVLDQLEGLHERGHTFSELQSAFNGLVVMDIALYIGELVRLATGIAPPVAAGRLLEMSLQDPSLREVERWARRADCPTCHAAEPKPAIRWGAPEALPAQR